MKKLFPQRRKRAKKERALRNAAALGAFAPLRENSSLLTRGNFIGSIAAAGAVSLLAPRTSRAAESSIEILINEPIGKIHPDM